jgi:diguanylate cyclase
MEPLLKQLADAVAQSDTLDDLIRPLLEILEVVSGLESTYLTSVDLEAGRQRILFSRNSRTLTIPEGLQVPWGDTLCKRALESGRPYTLDVEQRAADSTAARELGIKTYVSEPIRVGEGELFGTLCGASEGRLEVSVEAQRLLQLFSKLIARQIEHDRLVNQLRQQNADFMSFALSDPLTNIANRRGMEREIKRALSDEDRTGHDLHIAFIDLDGFKAINDRHGHDAGDRFLIEMARRLTNGLREGDLVARYGGDEFVVMASALEGDGSAARDALKQRLLDLTTGTFNVETTVIDYAGPSIGVITVHPDESDVDRVLARADKAMYEVKKARRREGAAPAR